MQKIPKGKRNVSHMEDSRCAVRLVNAFSPSVLAGIGNWQRRDAENRKNVVNNVRKQFRQSKLDPWRCT